jgi:signal transduction histidine kinase
MLDTLVLGPLWPYAGVPIAVVSITALLVLWGQRRTMLDLWLMVVMCLYLIEIPLSYYPVPVRFSLAFYAIRVMGIVSSSLILIVMLHETTTLYVRLLRAVRAQRRERDARLMTGDAVAAMIAHEIKQPLTGMVTSADAGLRFLGRARPDLNEARDAFKQIVADGHRAGALIGSIRTAFRREAPIRDWLDLNDLVREALALVQDDVRRHRIMVDATPNERLPQVKGNRIQLQQVLVNLITNAIESMAAASGSRVLSVRSEMDGGGEVMVSVADTGAGIESQDINQIFNPLFTTKPDGMGMGLSICRSIVDAHEGRLWVTPNLPHGAVFHFTSAGFASS